ncbi:MULTISPECIES: hypothetical protein [Pseudomonas]|uniref:Uncharacterized protein n=4 Tax=Pseudomonas TaxID=286 RepID=A0AAP7KDQ4_9PSED|nr:MULTISPECIES: hypothetical protein [Pseudomonas]AXQ51125.1 hypothetical protein DZC31_31075 [Stenotrophomonas rhizophila]MCO6692686.1 hypothetical protein [Pseudomonas shirazica]ESW38585.1 hypothetical protein O164_16960 [Pseudomonas taiwanensis SJ9]KIC80943.1 hypothetical protein RR51_18540 [Pseudomonas sp. C5pp]MCE0755575.1 hypothetical protein [Pseudomonas asiatica]
MSALRLIGTKTKLRGEFHMQYKVSYLLGDKMRDAIMAQKELDECRTRCEVVEAVAVSDQEAAPADSNSQDQANDDWTEFTHGGKRWAFDSDQLALWEEEEQDFHFHAYHGLVDPTIESVTGFIKRQGY